MPSILYFAVSRALPSRGAKAPFSETPALLILNTSLMIREVSSGVWQPSWLRRLGLLRLLADWRHADPPPWSRVRYARYSRNGLPAGWDRWAVPAEASARRAAVHLNQPPLPDSD